MRFTGFGEYAVDFFDGLEADNSKAYWLDHRDTYQSDVRAPMEALLAELAEEFGPGKVFRPFRDVRFSHDKSPYKTHCGGVVERGRGGGAYYVEVSAAGLLIGGGSFAMAADQLARYRTAVADERRGGELVRLLAALTRRGWELRGDRLKTRPRGVAADHPRLDLLRHRSLYVVRCWPPDDALHERAALTRVRAGWRQVREFNEWCADHVGLSARPW
ncbi:DUF2461 domain-containing protein [Goodfellowiella coeruleoviolacea]|uniref:TIGR02453 family protein n=1 Tax=Goodfellowiella coeruleoviolacea TaxID=334858 RepID=A0AAE3KLB5_9PSEU|nr:DUF2461 domain-containing protein [Goodfellowiella coeruleoviolacea]MCP2166358.1 TIGR02453 family protein [Goodfellowiella coeruleoviolacea]